MSEKEITKILESYKPITDKELEAEDKIDNEETKIKLNGELPSSIKKIKKLEEQIWKEGKYFPTFKRYKHFPVITACPKIIAEPGRVFLKRNVFTRKIGLGYKRAPKKCHIRKIVNYPYRRYGASQVAIVGNLNTGKSDLINLLTGFDLARGVRVLSFNDRRFEARNLAAHGYYDKNGFHPFKIDVWIPHDYKFMFANPIWEYYSNVNLCGYSKAEEIFKSMDAHKLTVVYDECFTEAGKIKLFLDLMNFMAENIDVRKNYLFMHHELSGLIPEVPTKEIYKLIRKVAMAIAYSRKDRIGLLTSFHMQSEIFYRIVQKFGYLCFKTPVNRKELSRAEKDAMKFGVQEVNITRAGYWMTHKIGYYPELPDYFRLIPQRKKLTYPKLKFVEEEKKEKKHTFDEKDIQILYYKKEGLSLKAIADKIGLKAKSTVSERLRKIKKQFAEA